MRAMILSALLLAACVADVGEGKVKAEVADAPTTEQPARAAATTVLTVDKGRSKLGLIGAKVTAKHPIAFEEYEGKVGLADGEVVSIDFTAQVDSIVSDSERLTGHLKKEDFLFVEQYPTATFVSTQVTEGAEAEGATHTVTGDLTIRGQSKRVTFPAKITVTEGAVEASTEFVIDRQDFGVTYPGQADDLVQDNVLMQISFVAPSA